MAKTFDDGKVHSNEEEVLTHKGEKVSLIAYSAPITDEEGSIVADNGKGIPAEWSTKVFDNFFSTKGDKGTGLGLLVARKVVQEHHGNISFTSEPNQGTTFRVILPIRQESLFNT